MATCEILSPPARYQLLTVAQQILDQHQSLIAQLETHASILLVSMQEQFAKNNIAKELILARLVRTEDLITFFKESIDTLVGRLSRSLSCHH